VSSREKETGTESGKATGSSNKQQQNGTRRCRFTVRHNEVSKYAVIAPLDTREVFLVSELSRGQA